MKLNLKHIFKNQKNIISKVLIFAFVFNPLFGVFDTKTANAQSNLSGYGSGSIWGNSNILNNPEIGGALKSCLQSVPSFQNKITNIFSKSASLNTAGFTPTVFNSSDTQGFCKTSATDKWASSDFGSVPTAEDLIACQKKEIDDVANSAQSAIAGVVSSTGDEVQSQQLGQKLDSLNTNTQGITKTLDTISSGVSALNQKQNEEKIRVECMDSIAFSLAKTALAGITESTVNLINTGNFGDPFYIKNTGQYFEDLNKTTLKQVFGGLIDDPNSSDRYPFLRSTYRNLVAQNVPVDFRDRAVFTLDTILSGQPYTQQNYQSSLGNSNALLNAYKNDFSIGGWEGWLALTQNPQNNPIGFGLLASRELSQKQSEEQQRVQNELDQSGGYLSMRRCVKERRPEYAGTGVEFNTRDVKAKPDSEFCVQSEVVTPGSLLAARLDAVITSDVRQLELADRFDQSLNQIFVAAFNKLTSVGLSALSDKVYGSWADQVKRESFVQTYVSNPPSGTFTGGSGNNNQQIEIVYRPSQNSFSTYNFDITNDLFDKQIGCSVQKGVLNVQKDYLAELEKSLRSNSPLSQFMPTIAELDFCIPGPTTNWEDLADENFEELIALIQEDDIGFSSNSANTYAHIGSEVGKIQKRIATGDTIQQSVVTGLRVTGAILSIPPASPIGAIILAGAEVVNLVTNIARSKQKKENENQIEMLNRASNIFPEAVNFAFQREGREWALQQINNLRNDYEDYKDAVYDKFSDANSIPVAKDARLLTNNLAGYSGNIYAIRESYLEEIDTMKSLITELQTIHDRVKQIKSDAEKRGTVVTMPPECTLTANQCPGGLAVSYGNRLSIVLPAGIAPGAGIIDSSMMVPGPNFTGVTLGTLAPQNLQNSAPAVQSTPDAPDFFIYPNLPVIFKDDANGVSQRYIQIVPQAKNDDTLSFKLNLSHSGLTQTYNNQEIFGGVEIGPITTIDGAKFTVTAKGLDIGKSKTLSCEISEPVRSAFRADCK